MNNRAFTLLELLVVITIIGILSSIVIVSMSGSTDSATISKGKAYAQQIYALLGHQSVLSLNFNENDTDTCPGGKDVCDASGYGNHGTLIGDAHFVSSDIDGYALSFDGSGDYVNLPTGIFTGWIEGTITLWIKTTESDNSCVYYNCPTIFGADVSGYSDDVFNLYTKSGELRMWSSLGGETDSSCGSNTYINDNTWYFISVILNKNNKCSLYINSELKCQINGGDPIFNRVYTIMAQSGGDPHEGVIDEVRIYKEALSSIEIQRYFVQGLEKLLANQAITQVEYDQRIDEFNQYLTSL